MVNRSIALLAVAAAALEHYVQAGAEPGIKRLGAMARHFRSLPL
jgi:hypothetical protein